MTEAARQIDPATPLLQLDAIEFSFGARKVLDGFGVSVPEGEIHGLLGPNGSGKSTALNLLTGLLPPQQGSFLLRGATFKPDDRSYLQEVGVVFQSPSLDLALSCRENLHLAARLRGIPGSAATDKVERALSQADLVSRAEDIAAELSGGMRRRLDIARALLHDPTILLLDEPTSGLDEAAFRATWSGIERARSERSLTVLVATHRADEAERCDRISIIAEGKNLVTDTPSALKNQLESDVIVIEAENPETLCSEIKKNTGLEATLESENSILVECAKGHELIPQLVSSFPQGRLKTLSLRQPTLADVFVKATGRGLNAQEWSNDA